MAGQDNVLVVGDRVVVKMEKSINGEEAQEMGIIRFVGDTFFSDGITSGEWIGAQLDRPSGKNNGTIDGVIYFECQPKYGIFVRRHLVTKVAPREAPDSRDNLLTPWQRHQRSLRKQRLEEAQSSLSPSSRLSPGPFASAPRENFEQSRFLRSQDADLAPRIASCLDAALKSGELAVAVQPKKERPIEELQSKMTSLSSGAPKELADMLAAHATALEALKRQLATQLVEETSQLRKAHDSEMQYCKSIHLAEVAVLNKKIEQLEKDLESGSSGLKEKLNEISELRESLKGRDAELSAAKKTIQEGMTRQQELSTKVTRIPILELELETLRLEAAERKRHHDHEIERVRQRLEGDTSLNSQRHREEMERMRKEFEEKLVVKEQDKEKTAQERLALEAKLSSTDKETKSQIDDTLKKLREVKSEKDKEAKEREELLQKIATAKKEIKAKQAEIERLQKENQNQETRESELKARIKELETKANEAKEAIS